MDIEVLKPTRLVNGIQVTYAALLVDNTYVVELTWTIMGSIRVTCREKEDVYSLPINWCCGNQEIHVILMLNTLLCALEEKAFRQLPPHSDIKPYYNDPYFLSYVHPWYLKKIFVTLNQITDTSNATRTLAEFEADFRNANLNNKKNTS